jgi:hypothetical protein
MNPTPRLALLWLLPILNVACATHLQRPYAAHVLPLDRRGLIADIKIDVADERSDAPSLADPGPKRSVDAQIERIVQGILRTNLRRIAIYVHGGLVSLDASIEEAEALVPAMLADGVYPVLVSWETGGSSAYGEHLISARGGRSSSRKVYMAKPLVELPLDLLSAAGEAPRSYAVASADSVRSNRLVYAQRAAHLLCERPSPTPSRRQRRSALYHDPSALCERPFPVCDGSPHFVCSSAYTPASRRASRRHSWAWIGTSPAKLLTVPLVYSVGPSVWDVLLRRSRLVFHTQWEFRDARGVDPARASGALAKFLDELNRRLPKSGRDYEITLIGHSMGAIVLNEVLSRFTRPGDLRFSEIVYLAAAASTRESLEAVTRYLSLPGNEGVHFYNLSLHPHAEDRESSLGGITPDGSLLVWIDSMFQNPPSFMERTFGRWENVRPALHLVPRELRGRMHFRLFGLDSDDPQGHGEANDTCRRFWLRSYWLGPAAGC